MLILTKNNKFLTNCHIEYIHLRNKGHIFALRMAICYNGVKLKRESITFYQYIISTEKNGMCEKKIYHDA